MPERFITDIPFNMLFKYFQYLDGLRADRTVSLYKSVPRVAKECDITYMEAKSLFRTWVRTWVKGRPLVERVKRARGEIKERPKDIKAHRAKILRIYSED